MKDRKLDEILQSMNLDANHAPDLKQWQAFLALLNTDETAQASDDRPDNLPEDVQAALLADDGREMDDVDRRVAELENAQKDLVAANSRLAYDAHHDALTGVYNRAFFSDILEQKLAARTEDTVLALMFIDFDGFKQVNDSMGHLVGDQLLIQISERLSKVIRKTDYLARIGGDEFTILATVKERGHTDLMAQRIISIFNSPVMINDVAVKTSASVGIVIDDNGTYKSADKMIRDSDTAMYRAKRSGKGCFQFYDQALRQEGDERIAKEQELEQAVLNDELFVVYQPIVDIEAGRVTGAEAYVRWDHPQKGELSAQEFLPLAEEVGLIAKIDAFSLDSACKALKTWKQKAELGDFRMGINLSLGQLQRADLIPFLWNALDVHDLKPSDLSIEIAETNLFLDEKLVHQNIRSLDELGIEIMIDGFGTGYSSLSCFNKYKLHGIKVDRLLTKEIETENSTRELMQSILQMAKTLKIKPAVEGVETVEQLAVLREMGCRYAQGYLFAKPERSATFFNAIQSNTIAKKIDDPHIPMPKTSRQEQGA